MQTGPALVAMIKPTRKRACPADRVIRSRGHALLSSCNRLGRAGNRAVFSQINMAQLTAKG